MKLINGGLKTKSSDEIINISRKQQLATLIIKWFQIKSERKFANLSPKKLKNNINNKKKSSKTEMDARIRRLCCEWKFGRLPAKNGSQGEGGGEVKNMQGTEKV